MSTTVTGQHTSPLVRFLHDPSGELLHALTVVERSAAHLIPLAIAVGALAAASLVTRLLLTRMRERRLARGARLLELAVPPELDAEGALLLWSALHDLLRPRFARLFGGQPQLAWEIAADRGGSRFRLWLPGAVPPGLVERALVSAWPGITISLLEQSAERDAAAVSAPDTEAD
jgi:hypothetical protein